MVVSAKMFALGAAAGDAALVLAAALQSTPAPGPAELIGGGLSGGAVSLIAWYVYKEKVDRHEKVLDLKADSKDLVPIRESIERIEQGLDFLVKQAMGRRD